MLIPERDSILVVCLYRRYSRTARCGATEVQPVSADLLDNDIKPHTWSITSSSAKVVGIHRSALDCTSLMWSMRRHGGALPAPCDFLSRPWPACKLRSFLAAKRKVPTRYASVHSQ